MNLKPTILICGTSSYASSDLLGEATPAGTIPENTVEDSPLSDQEPGKTVEDSQSDGKPTPMISRFVKTSVANFIEANDLTELGEDGIFPKDLSMRDYVNRVEAELRTGGLLPDDRKIDVIWYCAGDLTFTSEFEKDFIRSAAGVPNAIVVSSPMIISNRMDFRKAVDELTCLAGGKRVVLAPGASSGLNFMSASSGTRYLVEKTKWQYLERADASDEEKEAFEAAWDEFYGDKFAQWQENLTDSLANCIGQAAGRANYILGKPTDVPLTDLVEEGVDLLGELIGVLRGDGGKEVKPGKRFVMHTAELTENIELLIYEIAACYGHAAVRDDVDVILRHSKTSRLPGDAAAITYAVGQVAKAFYEPDADYDSRALLRIFREAMEEAGQKEFRPFDDADPLAHLDDCFEMDEEDLDDSDKTEDAGEKTGSDGETADVSHVPADELPGATD